MKKKWIALFLLYGLQFAFTACSPPCDCDDASIFEITYTEVELTTYDTSGFRNAIAETNIPKNAFGLEIFLNADQQQIADRSFKLNLGGFGFNSAVACDCVPPEYVFKDPIIGVEILVTDTITNTSIEVTDNFTITDFNDEVAPFSTFFESRNQLRTNFQLDLSLLDNIPDTSIFTVNLTLESGTIISKSTNMITFI